MASLICLCIFFLVYNQSYLVFFFFFFGNAVVIVIPFSNFKGITHIYLLNISVAINKNIRCPKNNFTFLIIALNQFLLQLLSNYCVKDCAKQTQFLLFKGYFIRGSVFNNHQNFFIFEVGCCEMLRSNFNIPNSRVLTSLARYCYWQ